jgi:hypothetical protein
VDLLVHVDALDRAAALAGVVHRAVGQRLGRSLGVGVLAHIGRVLAAQLELQLDELVAHGLRDALPVATEPVKNTPSTGCSSSGAHRAGAHQADHHLARHAGLVQQARDFLAGHGRVFRRLVQHGVAGEQRGHDDVAAHEPGVVPGRDVGHHTQRRVLDLLPHAAIVKDRFGGHRQLEFLQEKVDAPEQAVELVARHLDGLAGLARHGHGERLEVAHHAGAEALDAGLALGHRRGSPGWLGGAGGCGFGCHRCGVVGGQVVMSWPLAGCGWQVCS